MTLNNSTIAIMSEVDRWVGGITSNPMKSLVSSPLQTIVLLGASIVLPVLLFDLFGYALAHLKGEKGSYVPFSKNLVNKLTGFWDNRGSNLIGQFMGSNLIGQFMDPYYRNSRSLEPMVEILDSLSEAWKKWDDGEYLFNSTEKHL